MGLVPRFIEALWFERRRLKEALRDAEDRVRALFEQAAVGMLLLQDDGLILAANAQSCSLLGYDAVELRQQSLSYVAPPEDAAKLQALGRDSSGASPPVGLELRLIRKDGSLFWTAASASPLKPKLGRKACFYLTLQDQTSVKAMAAEMKRAADAALAASRTKGAFLANMSHDIRTPLNAILGFSEILAEGDISDDDRVKFTATLRRNGSLLARIMDDILDLSKVEAGKLDVERHDVSLPTLIADVTTLLGRQAQESGLTLKARIDGMVPERVLSDPTRLRQILSHIIGNAIKFTKHGTVELVVKAGKDEAGDDLLHFYVHDSGRGIAPEEVETLFQPFSQADNSTTRRHGGTGLGLALSRRLARLLHGDVTLERSEPGRGSTFLITIPAVPPHGVPYIRALPGEGPRTRPQGAVAAQRTKLQGLRVLLAEDAIDNQMLIRRILVANGATVDIAGDGLEVLTKAWANDYDIILMDLQMPRLDGYDATESLRRQGYRKPIIALTAHAMKEERERALKAGVNDHLTKPVSQNHLVLTVAQYSQATAH